LEGIKYVGLNRFKRVRQRLQAVRFHIAQRKRDREWRDQRYGG
jgi:hypothetical protein